MLLKVNQYQILASIIKLFHVDTPASGDLSLSEIAIPITNGGSRDDCFCNSIELDVSLGKTLSWWRLYLLRMTPRASEPLSILLALLSVDQWLLIFESDDLSKSE
jgi:hypothetical protein